MTLQLDNITVIPFLLTHLSQFGSNGSHVKAKPFGCYAALTAPPFPLPEHLRPGRKTSGLGEEEISCASVGRGVPLILPKFETSPSSTLIPTWASSAHTCQLVDKTSSLRP